MTQTSDKRVCLGVITSAHGIRGEVKIKPFTEHPSGPADYGPLQDKSGTRQFEIISSRVTGNVLVARLKGIGDRNAAEALKGVELYTGRENLPVPEDESWYIADLIGLAVFDPDNRKLGQVSAVHNFGAGDVLEIVPDVGSTSGLVPFTREHVPKVEIAAGRITVMATADLFEPAESEPDAENRHGHD
ncbi:MAG: ribosome maturation factor RimM [Fimbriimonadaceae bacterium]|nr:ribosome maturation factor RimM [Alphaproteobacteria bacterium]